MATANEKYRQMLLRLQDTRNQVQHYPEYDESIPFDEDSFKPYENGRGTWRRGRERMSPEGMVELMLTMKRSREKARKPSAEELSEENWRRAFYDDYLENSGQTGARMADGAINAYQSGKTNNFPEYMDAVRNKIGRKNKYSDMINEE